MSVKSFQKPAFLLFMLLPVVSVQGQQLLWDKVKKATNVDTAVFYGERYLAWAAGKNNCVDMVEATCFLSSQYSIKSKYTKAEKLVEKALTFECAKNDRVIQGRLYLELAGLNKYFMSLPAALNYYHRAQRLFEKAENWKYLVRCHVALAEYYRKLSKYKLAQEYIQSAFKVYNERKVADTSILIRIYNRAAAIDNESSSVQGLSISNSRKALKLARLSGDKDGEATSLNELGFSYKNAGRTDSSEYCYYTAEQTWFAIGADREALHAMNNRAMLYAHNNYPREKIMDLYTQMIHIVNSEQIDYPLKDAYSFLMNDALKEGDSARAYRYLWLYHGSTVDRIRNEHDIEVTNITERYENEKVKREVKRVENALSLSNEELEQKKAENLRAYIFLMVLVVLVGIVVFLFVRIKRTNKKLRDRSREKDVLIQEIHHRVKNNLQFISSLVNMQMNSSSNDTEIHTLGDASRRIKAMALVHEMLYNQKEAEGISIKQYLEELMASLNDVVNSDKIPIRFSLQIAETSFNVSDSIALGMIASELVSNSMKHAFKHTERPEIKVSLEMDAAKGVLFRVKDNGSGLETETETRKTLGMRLIDIFSRQLKGNYRLGNSNGCEYEIKFTIK